MSHLWPLNLLLTPIISQHLSYNTLLLILKLCLQQHRSMCTVHYFTTIPHVAKLCLPFCYYTQRERERERERDFGPIWLCCLNNGLHYLNNITCISTIFFHPHIFPQHLNNVTKTTLPNGPFLSCSLQFSEQGR